MQQSLIKIRPTNNGEYELSYIDAFSDAKAKEQVQQVMVIDVVDLREISRLLKSEAQKVGQ